MMFLFFIIIITIHPSSIELFEAISFLCYWHNANKDSLVCVDPVLFVVCVDCHHRSSFSVNYRLWHFKTNEMKC